MRRLRALVVANPRAGGGSGAATADLAARALIGRGVRVETVLLRRGRHVAEVVRERLGTVDRIVVCGGDGTISEAAATLAMRRSRTPLVVVPSGTGNDFARSLGIPLSSAQAAALAVEGARARIDVGTLDGRPFLNAVSCGVAAEISARVTTARKARLGRLAYVVTAIANAAEIEPFRVHLAARGFEYDGPVLFLAIANGRQVGGGSEITPHAAVNDGRLDLVLLPPVPARQLTGAIRALRMGGEHPALVRFRSRAFRLGAATPVLLSRDGEPVRAKTAEITAIPSAIRICVPRETVSAESPIRPVERPPAPPA